MTNGLTENKWSSVTQQRTGKANHASEQDRFMTTSSLLQVPFLAMTDHRAMKMELSCHGNAKVTYATAQHQMAPG